MPPKVYGRIAPRSGLAVNHGITVGAGVIDMDFAREVGVVLFNHGDKDLVIKKGHRIAQLILERCETPDVKEVSEMHETFRGGFGSTGLTANDYENACASWADREGPTEVIGLIGGVNHQAVYDNADVKYHVGIKHADQSRNAIANNVTLDATCVNVSVTRENCPSLWREMMRNSEQTILESSRRLIVEELRTLFRKTWWIAAKTPEEYPKAGESGTPIMGVIDVSELAPRGQELQKLVADIFR